MLTVLTSPLSAVGSALSWAISIARYGSDRWIQRRSDAFVRKPVSNAGSPPSIHLSRIPIVGLGHPPLGPPARRGRRRDPARDHRAVVVVDLDPAGSIAAAAACTLAAGEGFRTCAGWSRAPSRMVIREREPARPATSAFRKSHPPRVQRQGRSGVDAVDGFARFVAEGQASDRLRDSTGNIASISGLVHRHGSRDIEDRRRYGIGTGSAEEHGQCWESTPTI